MYVCTSQGPAARGHAWRDARRRRQPGGPGPAADRLCGERAQRQEPPPRERRPRLRRLQLDRGRAERRGDHGVRGEANAALAHQGT